MLRTLHSFFSFCFDWYSNHGQIRWSKEYAILLRQTERGERGLWKMRLFPSKSNDQKSLSCLEGIQFLPPPYMWSKTPVILISMKMPLKRKKKKQRDTVLLPLIKSTYHRRQMFVLNEAASVSAILEKYPVLSHQTVVSFFLVGCMR